PTCRACPRPGLAPPAEGRRRLAAWPPPTPRVTAPDRPAGARSARECCARKGRRSPHYAAYLHRTSPSARQTAVSERLMTFASAAETRPCPNLGAWVPIWL